ncbi:hypothetical protein [Oceaniglobus roseus]|uniref:hypothetical protein n=1 Tax=Oceaniglobus roseus TaxID=1737570 RepID=UPI001FEB8962|nr:hypothetical protein [Kandeliimicrobium roseum]
MTAKRNENGMRTLAILLGIFLAVGAGAARAEAVSLLGADGLFTPARALIEVRKEAPARRGVASLFADREAGGFFAPLLRPEQAELPARGSGPLRGSRVERLREVIGWAESRRHGYDAVQYGARIKPDRPPTRMTLGEIFAWIEDTPGQPHAIGKFQFIPATLARLVRRLDLSADTLFTPAVQDRLADELLAEAGFHAASAGDLARHDFMQNLAKIWAGLPLSSGKSYYDGYAGNAASMTWAQFDREMAKLFPG